MTVFLAFDVFLSSTFRDMQAERETLSRIVFPRVRAQLDPSFQLFERDLRWGLTETMVADGAVVSSCLDSVGECAPFVLGMIGAVTGTGLSDAFLDNYDQDFARSVPPNRSLTEWELRYAVHLGRASTTPIRALVRSQRMSDEFGFPGDAASVQANADLRAWLEQQSGVRVIEYDNLSEFEAVCEEALIAFAKAARAQPQQRPKDEPLESLDRRDEEKMLERLCRKGRPALIYGPSGSGSSWLANRWLKAQSGVKIALDGRTGSIDELLRKLHEYAGDLPPAAMQKIGADQSSDPYDTVGLALQALAMSGEKTAIVFDHFDEAFSHQGLAELGWIGNRLASTCKVLVLTHDPELTRRAQDQGWKTGEVGPPMPAAVAEFAKSYLARNSKFLDEGQAQKIAGAAWRGNMGAAVVALEELRRHGIFETIDAQIDKLAEAPTLSALVDYSLEGAARALPTEYQDAPANLLAAIALSLRGLERSELEMILARTIPEASVDAFPPHIFGALELMLAPFIVKHDGLYDLRLSCLGDWLNHPLQRSRIDALAPTFWQRLSDFSEARALLERPNVALQIGGANALADTLADPRVVIGLVDQMPVYTDGLFAQLDETHTDAVFAGWEETCDPFALDSEARLALARLAARLGANDTARKFLPDQISKVSDDQHLTVALQLALNEENSEEIAVSGEAWRDCSPDERSFGIAALLLAAIAGGVYLPEPGLVQLIEKQVLAYSTSRRSPAVAAQGYLLAGQAALPRREFRASLKHFTAAEKLSRRSASLPFLCQSLERRSSVLLELGKFSAARRAANECRKLAGENGASRWQALAFERLIEIAIRRSDWGNAYEIVAQYIAAMEQSQGDVPRARDCVDWIEAAARGGHF